MNPAVSSPPRLVARLLGGAVLGALDGDLPERASHRHVVALLALLAASPGRAMSRDRLATLLWPEGESEAVRHRLNVALYELRKTAGRGLVRSVNGDLHLDTRVLDLDLARFEQAVANGDAGEALRQYGGPFLEGFHLPGSTEFDQWADQRRSRFAAQLVELLEGATARAEQAGEPAVATRWYRRWVEVEPLASRPVVGLMRALGETGELAEALAAAEAHGRRLASELEAPPDPQVEALAQDFRSRFPDRLLRTATGSDVSPPEVPGPALHQVRSPAAPRAGWWRITRRHLVVALMAATVVMAAWVQRRVNGGAELADVVRIAVLPFAVHGTERSQYLAAGMAELLALTLDGAGPLRTSDPHAVLSLVRSEGGDPSDVELGARLASRLGAGLFLTGSVVETGERLDLRATLHHADGTPVARAAAIAADAGVITAAVDDLARQLLLTQYGESGERLVRVAIRTTASLPALRWFLEGETHRRRGAHAPAAEAFREAVAIDSTFALAWYRLAVVAERAYQPHEAAGAAEVAVRHSHRLPARDQLLLAGWLAYASGQAEESEALYQRVLDHYPEEVEAWLQLGEIRFHYAASRGRGLEEAHGAFTRVLEFDPAHEAARVHLARIAARQADPAELSMHLRALRVQGADTPTTLELRALLAFARPDRILLPELETSLDGAGSYTVLGAMLGLFHAGQLEGVGWCAGLLDRPFRPVEVRVAGQLVKGLLAVAAGRADEAAATADHLSTLDPLRGAELRAWLALLPLGGFPQGLKRADAESLLAEFRGAMAMGVRESFFLPDPDGLRPLMHRYLEGLLLTHAGDPLGAEVVAKRLEAAAAPASDPLLARDLALAVRAEIRLLQWDLPGAIAYLQELVLLPSYQLVLPAPFHPRVRERFLLGRLLIEQGEADRGRAVLAGTGQSSLYDLAFAPEVQPLLAAHPATRASAPLPARHERRRLLGAVRP